MENVITLLLVIILLIIVTKYLFKQWILYTRSVSIKSSIDNRYYIVRDNKNKQQSADTLALININIIKLIEYLKKEQNKTDIDQNIKLLVSRYNNKSLMENIELDNTTYTINKGSEISICLSTRDTHEKIYDINKLMFVIIHELSHIGCKSYGHNAEFRSFFIYLLRKAIEIDLYKYEDYSKQPVEYCGISINATPI